MLHHQAVAQIQRSPRKSSIACLPLLLAGEGIHPIAAAAAASFPDIKPQLFNLLTWAEDQWLSRHLPGLLCQSGITERQTHELGSH